MSDQVKPLELDEIIRYFERMRDGEARGVGVVPVFTDGFTRAQWQQFGARAVATLQPLKKERLELYTKRGFHGASD